MTYQNVRVRFFCPECGEVYDDEARDRCPEDGARLQSYQIDESDEDDPLIGEVLDGRFSIGEPLGEGGMGRVYRGSQLSVERDVAIKVLRAEIGNDEQMIQRFFREARVISKFSHPNIVNLIDFGQAGQRDVLYLVMEYIEGRELRDLLDQGRLEPALALEVVKQACSALAEPHEMSVVHRDLKPANLMLVPVADGTIQTKVVDFGIAHALQDEATQLTETGAVFGTTHYMAPEQARGGDVGPGTDIYALGTILFEMLVGRVPFDGENPLEIMMQHLQEEPPAIDGLVPDSEIPPEVVALTEDMMTKSVDERPSDVIDLRERIDRLQGADGLAAPRLQRQAAAGSEFSSFVRPRPEGLERSATDQAPRTDADSAYNTGDADVAAMADTLDNKGQTAAVQEVDPSAATPGDEQQASEPAPTGETFAAQDTLLYSELSDNEQAEVEAAADEDEEDDEAGAGGLRTRNLAVAAGAALVVVGVFGTGIWMLLPGGGAAQHDREAEAGESEAASASDPGTGGTESAAAAAATADESEASESSGSEAEAEPTGGAADQPAAARADVGGAEAEAQPDAGNVMVLEGQADAGQTDKRQGGGGRRADQVDDKEEANDGFGAAPGAGGERAAGASDDDSEATAEDETAGASPEHDDAPAPTRVPDDGGARNEESGGHEATGGAEDNAADRAGGEQADPAEHGGDGADEKGGDGLEIYPMEP